MWEGHALSPDLWGIQAVPGNSVPVGVPEICHSVSRSINNRKNEKRGKYMNKEGLLVQKAKCLGSFRTEPFCVFAQKALRKNHRGGEGTLPGKSWEKILAECICKALLGFGQTVRMGVKGSEFQSMRWGAHFTLSRASALPRCAHPRPIFPGFVRGSPNSQAAAALEGSLSRLSSL